MTAPDHLVKGGPGGKPAGVSLYRYMKRLIWLCVAPLVLLAAYLALEAVLEIHEGLERDATHLSQSLISGIDEDLRVRIGALQVLAESASIDDPARQQDFYKEAQRFQRIVGSQVVVADPELQMLLNTRAPFGARLPKLPRPEGRAAAPEALKTGRPAVGDVFVGPIIGVKLFAIAVPVMREGKAVLVLLTALEARQFETRVAAQILPPGWSLTLLDSKDVIMARSGAALAASGKSADGTRSFIVKSAVSQWSARLDIPPDVFSAPMVEAGLALALAIVLATFIGALGGMLASRRLGRMVAELAQPSVAGSAVPTIVEFAAVRRRLDDIAAVNASVESTLRESEMHFRQMFREGGLPNVLLNQSYQLIDMNLLFEQVFGYSRAELPDMDAWWRLACRDPDYRAAMSADWAAAVRQGALAEPLECGVSSHDGSLRTVLISSIRIGVNVLVTFFDITERKAAEQALRHSAELYQHTLDSILEGCQIIGFDWRYLYLNAAGAQQNRRPLEQLIGRTMMEIYPGIEVTTVFALLRACMELRTASQREVEFTFPDGQRAWFDLNVLPAAEGISIFSVDISQKKLAETALRKSQQDALEEQRHARLAALNLMEDALAARARAELANVELRKLSLAVEQSTDSIVITNLNAEIEYVNDAFIQNTGYQREEIIGQTSHFLHSGKTPPETYRALWEHLRVGEAWRGEFINRRKDGSEFVEFASISPLRLENGNVVHYVAVKEDITEKKRLALELDGYRHHLEEQVDRRTAELNAARTLADTANRAKGAFLANMSHEIRTPMNAIVGLTYLLRKGNPSIEQGERLEKIDVATRHLLAIVNDILDLSKIDAGHLQLEQVDFSLESVLENVRTLVADAARAKGLAIRMDYDHVPLWLHGDPTRLGQAMLNYVGNAVKFTEHGTIWLRALLLEESNQDLQVRFEVQDTGIGIPQSQLSTLFDAFTQADASITRKYGGTGLGLAINQRLAGLMGGEVGVESHLDHGSTFWLTVKLSRGRGEMPLQLTPGVLAAEDVLRRDYAGARILLAEDNPINQEVAVTLMNSVGLNVDTAENGRVALEKVRANSYDLVLMDVQMPELDGLAATEMMRADPAFAALPILAMTASAFIEDRQACIAAGMNDFVAKPVIPEVLYASLLHWLSNKKHDYPQAELALPVLAPAVALPTELPSFARIQEQLAKIPGLDSDSGLAVLLGDLPVYLRLLHLFVQQHGDDMTGVQACLDRADAQSAGLITHNLKGTAATLGIAALATCAAALDQALRQNASLEECSELNMACSRELAQICAAIRALPVDAQATQTIGKRVNPEAARRRLDELEMLLDAGDVHARTFSIAHRTLLRSTLGSAYPEFARRLDEFNFEEGLTLLRRARASIASSARAARTKA